MSKKPRDTPPAKEERISLTKAERESTLQALENDDWGEPTYPSHLVTTCHALRRKPLKDFTVEDLRIMIGENLSLEYLLPLAIEVLRENPWRVVISTRATFS